MSDIRNCPKCNGEMVEGFVPDVMESGVRQMQWIPGQPEKSFWVGIKTRGKSHFPIKTYCCVECGFLESYAILEQDSETSIPVEKPKEKATKQPESVWDTFPWTPD